LRIEIKDSRVHATLLSGHREVDCHGRFSGTSLLADNCDCFHVRSFYGCTVSDHTCKHQNEQANNVEAGGTPTPSVSRVSIA
jgi:hypothetical protein